MRFLHLNIVPLSNSCGHNYCMIFNTLAGLMDGRPDTPQG